MASTTQTSDIDLSSASSSGSEFFSSDEIIPCEQVPTNDLGYDESFSGSPTFNQFNTLPSTPKTPIHEQFTHRRDPAVFQDFRDDLVSVTTAVSEEMPSPDDDSNFSTLQALTGFSVESLLSDRKTAKRSRSDEESQGPASKRNLTADYGDINSFIQDFGQQIPQKGYQSPGDMLSDVSDPTSSCFDVYRASILANSDYCEDGLSSDQEFSSTAPFCERNFTHFPSTFDNSLSNDESQTFGGLYIQQNQSETAYFSTFYENDDIAAKSGYASYDDVKYTSNISSEIDGNCHHIKDVGISREEPDLEQLQNQYSDIYGQTRIPPDHMITPHQSGLDTSGLPVDNFLHPVQSYPTYENQQTYFNTTQQDQNAHSFVPVNHSEEFQLHSKEQICQRYLLQEMYRQQTTVPNPYCEAANGHSRHLVTSQPIIDLPHLSTPFTLSQDDAESEIFKQKEQTSCRSKEGNEVIIISSNPATPEKQQNSYCHASSTMFLNQNAEISDGRHISLKDYASSVTLQLLGHELWHKFHEIGTEMIITKAGRQMFELSSTVFSFYPICRRMFPSLKVSIAGLIPQKRYIMVVDILPLDNKRYRYLYSSSQWMAAGNVTSPVPKRAYVHPESPALGETWMRQTIVFDKMKLTNNEGNNKGHIILHSMHKYQPRIHLIECEGNGVRESETITLTQCVDTSQDNVLTFIFQETQFTTVTAYQNQQITKLKIDKNPFAKGFRDTARNCNPQDKDRETSDDKMRIYYRTTTAPVVTVAIEPVTSQHRYSNSNLIVQGNPKHIDIMDGKQNNNQDDERQIQWSG